MNSLEKLLQESSEFIKEVKKVTQEKIQDLEEKSSRELIGYHPLDTGHMLRPLLVYVTAYSFDDNLVRIARDKLIYFAAAVELMHNASLIHDDLLDQEEMRRGKPSLYKAFGFKNGLLAGNIFYIKAIELSNQYLEMEQTKDLLHAAIAMCEGEIFQAKWENEQIAEEDYQQIIRYKTGSLTALACRQSALIVGGDEEESILFGKLGEEIGIMYQLRDDKKDQDVQLDSRIQYQDRIKKCENKLNLYMEELKRTKNMKQVEEVIAYLKKQ